MSKKNTATANKKNTAKKKTEATAAPVAAEAAAPVAAPVAADATPAAIAPALKRTYRTAAENGGFVMKAVRVHPDQISAARTALAYAREYALEASLDGMLSNIDTALTLINSVAPGKRGPKPKEKAAA